MPEIPILDELGADLRAAFRSRERRRLRGVWAVPAVAVAAAAALLFGLDRGAPAPATAAEVLRRAAYAAQTAPAPFPRDDQYFYVHSLTTNLSMNLGPGRSKARLVTRDRRIWTRVARPGRLIEKPGREFDIGRTRYLLGSIQLNRAGMFAFPTEPRTIYERLRAQVEGRGHSPDGE